VNCQAKIPKLNMEGSQLLVKSFLKSLSLVQGRKRNLDLSHQAVKCEQARGARRCLRPVNMALGLMTSLPRFGMSTGRETRERNVASCDGVCEPILIMGYTYPQFLVPNETKEYMNSLPLSSLCWKTNLTREYGVHELHRVSRQF